MAYFAVQVIGSGLATEIDGVKELVGFLTVVPVSADSKAGAAVPACLSVLKRLQSDEYQAMVQAEFKIGVHSVTEIADVAADELARCGLLLYRQKRWWEFWK